MLHGLVKAEVSGHHRRIIRGHDLQDNVGPVEGGLWRLRLMGFVNWLVDVFDTLLLVGGPVMCLIACTTTQLASDVADVILLHNAAEGGLGG